MAVSLEHKLTEPETIAAAYGLLWLVSIDNRQRDLRRVSVARELLLSLLTKDGQRDGIARAKRMEADGLPSETHEAAAATATGVKLDKLLEIGFAEQIRAEFPHSEDDAAVRRASSRIAFAIHRAAVEDAGAA